MHKHSDNLNRCLHDDASENERCDFEHDQLKTYTVMGRKCAAHPECIDGFRTDRRYNLIYPSYNVEGEIMNVERASIDCSFCAYCGKDGAL